MKPTPTPEMIEAAAEAIYNLFTYDEPGEKPTWVERGNSFKQEDARRYAAAALSVPAAEVVGEPSKAYEAGYNDARADALRELRYAMRDIAEGETVKTRLQQCYDDIETKEMPEDTRGKG